MCTAAKGVPVYLMVDYLTLLPVWSFAVICGRPSWQDDWHQSLWCCYRYYQRKKYQRNCFLFKNRGCYRRNLDKASFCEILVLNSIRKPVNMFLCKYYFLLRSPSLYSYNIYLRSLGRVSLGHTVFISGLTCSMSKQKWWAHPSSKLKLKTDAHDQSPHEKNNCENWQKKLKSLNTLNCCLVHLSIILSALPVLCACINPFLWLYPHNHAIQLNVSDWQSGSIMVWECYWSFFHQSKLLTSIDLLILPS